MIDGPGPDALLPTRLPLAAVVRVVAGDRLACALDANGTVTCFRIDHGRLGAGETVRIGL